MERNVNKMSEKVFEGHIKDWIKEYGGWYIKYCAQTLNPKVGCPDILACIDGRFWGIEVKSMDGSPRPEQWVQLRRIRKAGGMAVIVYPTGFELLKKMVQAVKNHPYDPSDYPEVLK